VEKDDRGEVTAIHCAYEHDTRSGMPNSNKKVKGTLHWVSAKHAAPVEVRLYDRLFVKENPDDVEEGEHFKDFLNPESLKTITAYAEPSILNALSGDKYQFERLGYFCADPDSIKGKPVFNRTVSLKDTWAKMGQGEKI